MKLFLGVTACFLLLLTGSSAFAVEVQKVDTKSGFSAVYLIEDKSWKQVRAELIIHAGEYDWLGPEGGPHYLEHLVYWHANKDISKKYSYKRNGAWINGHATHFVRAAPSADLSETLGFVKKVFSQPKLDQQFMIEERAIVEREFDLRLSENPFSEVFKKLNTKFFGVHPLSRSVSGTISSIRANTPAALFDFHDQFYQPANATLLITGNINADRLRTAIDYQFAGVFAGKPAPRSWRSTIDLVQQKEHIEITDQRIKSKQLIDFRHMVSPKNWSVEKSYFAINLLQKILISTNNGSLARKLRYDDFLAESLSIEFNFLPNGEQVLKFSAKPDEDVSLNQLLIAYERALNQIARNGIPAKSFERLHSAMLVAERRLRNDFGTVLKRIRVAILYGFEPLSFEAYYRELETITRADINQYVRDFGTQRRRVTMFVQP